MKLFQIGNRGFGWTELVVAAKVWGEWAPFVESVRQSLTCLRCASETNQMPTAAATREAANAFRYAHNLISAEETEAWLKRWKMTLADWNRCLRSELLKKRWAEQMKHLTFSISIPDAEINEALFKYAVCSDKILEWSRKLAGRTAVAAEGFNFSLSSTPQDLILRIETEFQRTRGRTIQPKSINARINDHRLDWIHFECKCLWLAEERIAREAAWCVTQDGLSLDVVAADAKQQIRHWNFYADEMETHIRPYFLAARQGDFLGPWRIQNAYPLFSVISKRLPDSTDPKIVSRAEREIENCLLTQAMNEHVKWMY